MSRIDYKTSTELLRLIVRGAQAHEPPASRSGNPPFKEIVLPVGKDHVAYLEIQEDALEILLNGDY